MCLELQKTSRICKRKRPVVCFKVLGVAWADKNRFETPFQGMRVRTGDTKRVKAFSVSEGFYLSPRKRLYRENLPLNARKIFRGLHAYESIERARRGAYCQGRIIVRCFIPPNTPFIRGKKGEMAALSLVIGPAVYGKKNLRERFSPTPPQRSK